MQLIDIGANLTHDSFDPDRDAVLQLSLIHISEPTRQEAIAYAVFCL